MSEAENLDEVPLDPLSGRLHGLFKLRVGDHRVVFAIDHVARHITVRAVGHRSFIHKEAR
ncbi:type II toxin-antitoxin system RelE/ParE family toxin [bacterium]|nr:type II toxin-antitoxin system RelE/ParE family toxin [bacterium]